MKNSSTRLMLIIAFSIFTIEFGIMILFQVLPPFPTWVEMVMDSSMLVALLSPVLFLFVTRPLMRQIEINKQSEAAIHNAYNELDSRVRERTSELEQKNREASLLAEMSEFLLACSIAEEAYSVIVRTGQHLFPGTSGSLFIYKEHSHDLESAATWGGLVLEPNERVFAPEQCWALRRGRGHKVEYAYSRLTCQHVSSSLSGKYLCVPIIAQGEILGVVHLRVGPFAMETEDKSAHLHERLITKFVERVAPALANMNLREKLRHLSIRDPLTGLFNRRFMEETLEREIRRAERNQHPLGVIMLDLDHFKRFNDNFGHQAGDQLLRELGALLKSQVRSGDIACRYGGEEFVIVLTDINMDKARQRAEDIRNCIRNITLMDHDRKIVEPVTLSIGLALFPDHGETQEALIKSADQALYDAKHGGRNRVVCVQVESRDGGEHTESINEAVVMKQVAARNLIN